jgi:hypothetical protein
MQTAPITVSRDNITPTAVPYLSWTSIAAGSLLAAATLLILMPFGASIGLGMTSVTSADGASAATVGWFAIFWFAAVHLYSVASGAYVAGRLRPKLTTLKAGEVEFRDGMSGIVMWAIGVVISTTVMVSALTGATSSATSAISRLVGPAVATAAQSAAQSATPGLSSEYVTDLFLRTGPGQSSAAAVTPRSDADVRAEISRVIAGAAAAGDMSEEDRRYVAGLIASRTGLSETDARNRVNDTVARAKQAKDDAIAKGKAAAESARKLAASAAFWMTVLAFLTGITAWYMAIMGGRHRESDLYGTQIFGPSRM